MRIKKEKLILIVFFVSLGLIFSESIFAQGQAQTKKDKYAYSVSDRDPFFPLISKNGAILIPKEIGVTDLTLSGIIYSDSEPVAIINGEVLNEGGIIADYVVLEIKEKEVYLKKDNEGYTLKLEGEL